MNPTLFRDMFYRILLEYDKNSERLNTSELKFLHCLIDPTMSFSICVLNLVSFTRFNDLLSIYLTDFKGPFPSSSFPFQGIGFSTSNGVFLFSQPFLYRTRVGSH